MSALSELQQLEKELSILKKVLKGCHNAEVTSVAAARICTAIAAAGRDPLAASDSNTVAMAGGADSAGGCCVVC